MKRKYVRAHEKVGEPPKKRPVGRPPRETPKQDKASSTAVDDAAPIKAQRNNPLPVVEDLETTARTAYKSIAESGVLATSLSRSKTRWTLDGVLDRFWVKPSKKKGQVDNLANNPPKESMQKAGPCYITVEPHVFEAVIYSVRDLNPPPPPQPLPSTPSGGTPLFQYGPVPAFIPPKSGTAGQSPLSHGPSQPTAPQSQQHQPEQQSTSQPSQISTPQTQISQSNGDAAPLNAAEPTLSAKVPTPTATSPQPTTPNPPSQQGQDPVIQMLAQRASTNPELKVLMKIVASGSADSEQLRVFQSHIDDLTSILQQQNQKKPANNTPSTPQGGITTFQAQAPHNKGQFGTLSATGPTINHTGTPLYQPINRPAQPGTVMKPKVSTRSDIVGALIEFSGASGDRFSIPKHSILEYLPGGHQILISFIITRKGAETESSKYAATKEYWEPITMRLTTDAPKVLDVLGKAVAPYEDACRWMEETMKRATRADNVHLAFKLPTGEDGEEEVGTSSFLTPAESDRVRFLKNLASRPALGMAGIDDKPKKSAKNKQEDWDHNCQYCYAPPEDISGRDEDGKPICADCQALRRTSKSSASKTVRYSDTPRESHGPQALVISF